MVAERDRVGAGIEEFLVDRFGDAEAAGGVLAIDDDEIEAEAGPKAGKMIGNGGAAGLPDHVADEENAQITESGNRTIGFPLARNPGARRSAAPARRQL